MSHETQIPSSTTFPEDSGCHRALAPSAEEIALRTAARAACEATFREQWNQASRRRHAEGKPASFRGTDGRHLTLLPAETPTIVETAVPSPAQSAPDVGRAALRAAEV